MRTGAVLLPDHWREVDEGDLLKFWDMGMPAYRNPEDLNQWIVTWTTETMTQLENIQTPFEQLEQISAGDLVVWNDKRCNQHNAVSNTFASTLMRNLNGNDSSRYPRLWIYGPVLVTAFVHKNWHPIPPAPLTGKQVSRLFGAQQKVKMLVDMVAGRPI